MPPKIVKPRARTQMGARKPKVVKRAIVEEHKEEEQAVEEVQKIPEPKRETWLDKIHWEEPPDQKLHNELSKKRREKTLQKHQKYCEEELMGIFNFAFATMNADSKEIRRKRIAFDNGAFLPKIEKNGNNEINTINVNSKLKMCNTMPPVETLPTTSNEEGFKELMRSLSKDKNFEFDANPVIEEMLKAAKRGLSKYIEPAAEIVKHDFPFIVCIIGNQCTGKTTIAQYMKDHLNARVCEYSPVKTEAADGIQIICGNDEKLISQEMADIIPTLKEGEGLIIVNYPTNKQQLATLERAISMKEVQGMSVIHGLIKTDFSQADPHVVSNSRLIDRKTGRVFGEHFFMPDFISLEYQNEAKLEPFVAADDTNMKNQQNILAIEKSLKKSICATIPLCKCITELVFIVNNFVTALGTTKDIDISIKPSRFRSRQEYLYSKFCYDVTKQWEKECLPKLQCYLGKAFSQLMSVEKMSKELKETALTKFVLKINCRDQRNTVIPALLKERNRAKIFNAVWDQVAMMKSENLVDAKKIIDASGFTTIGGFGIETFKLLVTGMIVRYCITFWFINSYKFALLSPSGNTPSIVPLCNTNVDINDLVAISEIMYVDAFDKGVKLPEFCVKPKEESSTSLLSSSNMLLESMESINSVEKLLSGRSKSRRSGKRLSRKNSELSSIIEASNLQTASPTKNSSFETEISNEKQTIPTIVEEQQKPGIKIPHDPFPQKIDWSNQESCEALFRRYFTYARDSNPYDVLKGELDNLLKAMEMILREKDGVTKSLGEQKSLLEKQFFDIIQDKYQHEMENFSRNIILINQGNQITAPLFAYDSSSLKGRLADLCNSIGCIADPNDPRFITQESLTKLERVFQKRERYINVDELKEIARESQLTEQEITELELIVRMELNPYLFDPINLCSIIHPPQAKKRPQTSFI